jgi:integrase
MAAVEFTIRYLQALKPGIAPKDYYDKKVTGFGVRLSPGGKKTFFYRYRNKQRRMRKVMLGSMVEVSLADARAKAREMSVLVQKGTDLQAEIKRERVCETVTDVAELFIAYSKENNRPKTSAEDERMLRKDVFPAFGAWKLKELRRKDIIALLDKVKSRRTRGARGAPVAANRLQQLLSRLFEFAVNRELIETNPIYRLRKLTKEKPRNRRLTDDEIRLFLIALKAEKNRLIALLLELTLLLARRRGEILAWRWDEITDTTWTIPADRSKNKRAVPVPLSMQAQNLLEELKSFPFADPQGYVFPSPKKAGSFLADPKRVFTRIRKNLNIENFTIHDLRRTAASRMRTLGIPKDDVEAVLGHAEGRLIETYQCDFPLERMKSALQIWADHLDKLTQAKDENQAKVIPLRRKAQA